VQAQKAFYVTVANDVIAIDDDDSRRKDLDQLIERFRIPCVLLASGRPGHHHLFAKIDHDPALHAAVECEASGLGLDVRRFIRPPLAPHRLGGASRLLDPADEIEALARLTAPHGMNGLSPRMTLLLRLGDLDSSYASRSEVLQAILQASITVGMDFETTFNLLRDRNNVGGKKLQETETIEGAQAASSYLRRCWGKAAAHSAATQDELWGGAAIAAIQRSREQLAGVKWQGLTGATDWRVFTALLNVSERLRSNHFPISQRELMEQAGIGSRNTITASLQRLEQRGLLNIDSQRQPHTAHLNLCSIEPVLTSHPPLNMNNGSELHINDDAFRSRNNMSRIYVIISRQVSTRITLIEATGLNRTTVDRNLKRLTSSGLIGEDAQGRLHVNRNANLEDIAKQFGTFGVAASQHARHEQERALYRKHRTEADWFKQNGWQPDTTATGLLYFTHDATSTVTEPATQR